MGINAKIRRDINSPDFFYLLTAYSVVGMGCCRPNVLPQPEQRGHKVTQSTVLYYNVHRTVQPCRTCDHKVASSNLARGCCVGLPTPTQRATPAGSVNEYQRKLGSKRAYHAMRLAPYPRSCSFAWYPADSRATGNGDQCRPMGL